MLRVLHLHVVLVREARMTRRVAAVCAGLLAGPAVFAAGAFLAVVLAGGSTHAPARCREPQPVATPTAVPFPTPDPCPSNREPVNP